MPLDPQLDNSWNALMALCDREREYQATHSHPKLLRFISDQIDRLANDLGFSRYQIAQRQFRAEKFGERVVRMITE
jgi:hypothetical protein